VVGPDKVARLLVGITSAGLGTLDVRPARINGQLGVIAETESKLAIAAAIDVVDGLVSRVYIMANPDKLAWLAADGE
jgi:RNA polymerase sigma-70 factor (ECF subfamily)